MVLLPVSRVSSYLSNTDFLMLFPAYLPLMLSHWFSYPVLLFHCSTSSLQTQFSVALPCFSLFREYWEFVEKIGNYEVVTVEVTVFLNMWLVRFDIQLNIYFMHFLFEYHFFSKLYLKLIFPQNCYIFIIQIQLIHFITQKYF